MPPINQLTPRELSVLTLIAQGYSDKQIALELGLARSTVSNCVGVILQKLSAPNRTCAAVTTSSGIASGAVKGCSFSATSDGTVEVSSLNVGTQTIGKWSAVNTLDYDR